MKIAILHTNGELVFTEVEDNERTMRMLVGGAIQTDRLTEKLRIIYRLGASAEHFAKNPLLPKLYGPVLAVHHEPGDEQFSSLTNEDMVYLLKRFSKKESAASVGAPAAEKRKKTYRKQYTAKELKSQIHLLNNERTKLGGKNYCYCLVAEELMKELDRK